MPLPALLNYRKNVRSVERELDAREIVTRAYPQGAAEDGYHMTMAEARWRISGINANQVWLEDDAGGSPIRFDDQLNGLYARKWPTSAQWLVTDSSVTPQKITLQDTPDTLAVGDYIQFRDASGNELVYLDRPAAQESYGGVWEGICEREDIPNVDNLHPNGFMNDWSGGLPVGILDLIEGFVGVSTVTQNTSTAYRQFGRYSAKVQMFGAGAANMGVETDWINVYPTAEKPFFSFQAAFFLTLGAVQMDVRIDLKGDGTQTVYMPDITLPVVEDSTGKSDVRNNAFRKLNQWTFAGIGGLNLYDDPDIGAAKRVKLRIHRLSDAAEMYLDALMITQTAGGSEAWYDRLASNTLWHAANDYLEANGEPLARYEVRPLDLFREDPDAFAFDELKVGGQVRVRDNPLGIEVTTRVKALRRDLTEHGQNVTEMELTNQSRALSKDVNRGASLRPRTTTGTRVGAGEFTTPPTTGGALSGLTVAVSGTTETLTWDHNEVVQDDGAGRFTVDIRSTKGGVLTLARNPKFESGGSDTQERRGGYQTTVTLGGGSSTTNVYTVTLKDAGAVLATYQTSVTRLYA